MQPILRMINSRTHLLLLVVATALASSCTRSAFVTSAPRTGRGTLQVVGGGTQPRELVQHFVDLAGGRGRARIAVFAMASASGEQSGEGKARDFRELGAEARNIWI